MVELNARKLLSDAKFYDGYSRWSDKNNRYETWDESVDRVMEMHKGYYKDKLGNELNSLIEEATESYKQKYALGAQRALQFGGDQLLKHQLRNYNCTNSYADRPAFFNELFYILLCGAGAGFSVQHHHVAKLPEIAERKKHAKAFVVEDSIEGWADSLAVLLSSYFVGGGEFPEYEGRKVYFDLTKIRPKGAIISGGFKAPGPDPLRKALDKIEYLLQGLVFKNITHLRPIHAYDIAMHASDAVLAGGVRRSATICLFSADDAEMASAKTGNWFIDNPQRARSNNSAVIVRDEITREQFAEIMKNVKAFGEPGFYFVTSKEHGTNPCVEIGMFPKWFGDTPAIPENYDAAESGWQACNLTEINGGKCNTPDEFYKACRAAAILGTLQAGYTEVKYVKPATKKILEREALLGVSITGWMNNPQVLFDREVLKKGAEIVKAVNKEVALLLGINPAARTTCTKPSGNASVILMTASGIHAEHSKRYLRFVQMNKESEVANLIKKLDPYMVEESVWSANKTDYSVAFPITAPETSIFREQMLGVDFLEKVKLVQESWVEFGTNIDLCVDPTVRHNVSNTVTVKPDQWEEVEQFVFDNRYTFSGISFLADSGDKDYHQAPNTEVRTEEEIVNLYGAAALFASGLIVDGLKVYPNLWQAIANAINCVDIDQEKIDNQTEWNRRFHKFASRYLEGNVKMAEYCLKDVYLLFRWKKIEQSYVDIQFEQLLTEKKFTDVDTIGSAACIGPDGCLI